MLIELLDRQRWYPRTTAGDQRRDTGCVQTARHAAAWRRRQRMNRLTGATPLGLLLARLGGARLVPGPHGLTLACGVRPPVPVPAAAVTVGDVVLLRMSPQQALARPRLLAHEARHAAQWARWLGPVGFLPAYAVASAWSWLRHRDAAVGNRFEVRAGLLDGGYGERARRRGVATPPPGQAPDRSGGQPA